jgi:hypothetical protein
MLCELSCIKEVSFGFGVAGDRALVRKTALWQKNSLLINCF